MRGGDGAERSLLVMTVPFSYRGQPALLGTATDVTLQPDVLNASVRMAALDAWPEASRTTSTTCCS